MRGLAPVMQEKAASGLPFPFLVRGFLVRAVAHICF
jgi:hypothetical protein